MGVCQWCHEEMGGEGVVDSCISNTQVEFPSGEKLPSSTAHFDERSGRCHDCNIKHNGFHHPGCDVEQCPNCEGQLISCGCLDEEEEVNNERQR